MIELRPGTYDLQLAKVGLGTGVSDETEQYLTDVGGTAFSINSDETQTVTVEARDRFNRPLSGVTINATAENYSDFATNKTTGPDGQARFTYDPAAAAEGQRNTLNFTYQPIGEFNASGPESVQMTVNVTASTSTPVNGSSNVYNVTWATEAMSTQEGVTEAGANRLNITVDQNQEPADIDLIADVFDGTRPIKDAAVDLAINTTPDSSSISLSNPTGFEYTDAQGRVTVSDGLEGLGEASDGDEAQLYATAGDDVARLSVQIIRLDGTTMADRTSIPSAVATNGAGSIVDVNISTTGTDDVVITGLGIEYVSSGENADVIATNGGTNEVAFTGPGQYNAGGGSAGVDIGSPPVTFEDGDGTNEIVAGGDSTTMTLTEFKERNRGDQPGDPVDVSEDTFDITLTLQDGTSKTYTVTIDP